MVSIPVVLKIIHSFVLTLVPALQIMFAVWWITAVWFFTWVINYGHVRNWFRETCDVSQATTVYVWAPVEVRILTAHVSPLVWVARKLRVSCCHQTTCVPLHSNSHAS